MGRPSKKIARTFGYCTARLGVSWSRPKRSPPSVAPAPITTNSQKNQREPDSRSRKPTQERPAPPKAQFGNMTASTIPHTGGRIGSMPASPTCGIHYGEGSWCLCCDDDSPPLAKRSSATNFKPAMAAAMACLADRAQSSARKNNRTFGEGQGVDPRSPNIRPGSAFYPILRGDNPNDKSPSGIRIAPHSGPTWNS